jgi:endonuclease/exonuclease/phosphatase family metal-dependent hydrolase
MRRAPARRGRRIVMGDMNEWYDGPVARGLREEIGPGGAREPSHPALVPLFALDRIHWDEPMRGEMHVHRRHPARIASDHLPVVARLEV